MPRQFYSAGEAAKTLTRWIEVSNVSNVSG